MTMMTTPEAAWNAQAARVQAERAIRAENERDTLVMAVARLSNELREKDELIAQLRAELAAASAWIGGYDA